MQLNVPSVQLQLVPEIAVAVKLDGNVSVTITATPVVAPVPVFVAVSVNVAPVCPCEKDPVCELVTVISGAPPPVTVTTVAGDVEVM